MNLYVKLLREGATLPMRQTEGSAGYDIAALPEEEVTLLPGEIALIPTGLAVAPEDCPDCKVVLLLYARSSLASKFGVTLANCVGVVDADYRGELKIPLINLGKEPFTVRRGERIAQLVVTPVLLPEIVQADVLDTTARGEGGFGSTGYTTL